MPSKNKKRTREWEKQQTYQMIYDKFQSPLDQLYIETIQTLFTECEPVIGKKLMEQYQELMELGIERIQENSEKTYIEKRIDYLHLLNIRDVDEFHEFVSDLEEEKENHYSHYSSFYREEETEEWRREIESACLEFISDRFASRMVEKIIKKHPYLLRLLQVNQTELVSFLEYTFDDLYDWLSNEVSDFDELHFSIPYVFHYFDQFPKVQKQAEKLVQSALEDIRSHFLSYDEELNFVVNELKTNETLASTFIQDTQELLVSYTTNQLRQANKQLTQYAKTPQSTQKVLLFMETYEKKEWTFEEADAISTMLKQTPFSIDSTIQQVYMSFMKNRKKQKALDNDSYKLLSEEVGKKDVLDLTTFLSKERTQLITLFPELNQLYLQFMNQLTELKKREEKWITEVLGPSVFETYKRNAPSKIVIHVGLTNTGKTYESLQRLKEVETGLYLAPLRLLALENYEYLNQQGVPCSLKTGEEEKITEGALHISSTVELCSLTSSYDCVVIDECQMIGDEERGSAWVRAILGVHTKELHVITAPEGLSILRRILDDKEVEIVHHHRKTALEILPQRLSLKKVKKGDAVIVFSRINVLKVAKQLENNGFKPAIIYGSMPPSVRQKQVEHFHQGKLDVVVSTDAIGMGMNLPVQRVLFMETSKYDGKRSRFLTPSEFKQIGGRAGRKGMFDVGYVGFMEHEHQARKTMLEKPQAIQKVVISPTFEMFTRFVEALNFDCEIRALKTFIHYWRTYKPDESFVKIHQMTHQMSLVNKLQQYETKQQMSLQQIWKFVHIPFDSTNATLLDVWKQNIKSIIQDDESYELPLKNLDGINQLEDLELAYKRIDTHLSFCEDGDVQFRYYDQLKEAISEKIFRILTERIQHLTKKCKHCKTRLKLTYEYAMCQSCYKQKYQRHYHDFY